MANGLQIAVARADMLICAALGLPWRRIALSLAIAAISIKVVKAVIRGDYDRR